MIFGAAFALGLIVGGIVTGIAALTVTGVIVTLMLALVVVEST